MSDSVFVFDPNREYEVRNLLDIEGIDSRWLDGFRDYTASKSADYAVDIYKDYLVKHNRVTDIRFEGNVTTVVFADGTEESVTYRSEYGHDYDREVGVMICMLKHAFGNYYLHVLSTYRQDIQNNASHLVSPSVQDEGVMDHIKRQTVDGEVDIMSCYASDDAFYDMIMYGYDYTDSAE